MRKCRKRNVGGAEVERGEEGRGGEGKKPEQETELFLHDFHLYCIVACVRVR
jgi:hypothetical protein